MFFIVCFPSPFAPIGEGFSKSFIMADPKEVRLAKAAVRKRITKSSDYFVLTVDEEVARISYSISSQDLASLFMGAAASDGLFMEALQMMLTDSGLTEQEVKKVEQGINSAMDAKVVNEMSSKK